MNITANGSSCSLYFTPASHKIGATLAFCFIFVVSILGNLCIGIIVYRTQTLRKPVNLLIVNMALSDLVFAVIVIPLSLIQLHFVKSWIVKGALVGNAFCKLVPFVIHASFLVSVQNSVLIAVDRFGAVVFPLRSPVITTKLYPFFILATWIVAMAVVSPFPIALSFDEKMGACAFYWKENFGQSSSLRDYVVAWFVVFIYIPAVLLCVLYSSILVKLNLQKLLGEQTTTAQKQRAKRNRHVLKMAIAILLGFMLCWLPWSISTKYLLFNDITLETIPCGSFIYWNIIWFIAVSHAAVNPCICLTFSGNYREGLKRLLKSFVCKGESQNESFSSFPLNVVEKRTWKC